MVLIALMTLELAAQNAAWTASGELYAPPVVRPFEPSSGSGRVTAQGDADAGIHRRPIAAPVVVEAYRRSYEVSPSDAEIGYEQGVNQARLNQDARMGPLDGRWRVTGADGKTLLDLVLSDRGSDTSVEGAWSRRTVEASAQSDAHDMGVVDAVDRDAGAVVIKASVDGRPVSLHLRSAPTGWSGRMTGADGDQPVTMAHTN